MSAMAATAATCGKSRAAVVVWTFEAIACRDLSRRGSDVFGKRGRY